MIRSFFLAVHFLLSGLGIAFAQTEIKAFGTVAAEDFVIDPPADLLRGAEAIVLHDIGESYFDGTLDLVLKRHVRIKVLSSAGLRWGLVEIPYYSDGYAVEELEALEGYSYNLEDGKLVKSALDISTVYNEKLSGYWSQKKFAMPAVREGTILEYRYTIKSPFHFNLHDWEFQSEIPCLYSSYEVRLTPFFEYVYVVKGSEEMIRDTAYVDDSKKRTYNRISFKETVNRFEMTNIPAFSEEEFVSSQEDHLIKLDFQLSAVNRTNGTTEEILTTWPKLIEALEEHADFGKYIEKSGITYAYDLRKLGLESMSKPEKAKAVIEYVRTEYRWNGYYGELATRDLKDFHKQKSGNVANINLFLIGLLRQIGIEANPVILSTRGHGKIYKQYPFEHFFNYVVAMISFDDYSILVDATESAGPFDKLPPRCLNDDGLLVKKGFEKWVNIRENASAGEEIFYYIQFNPSADRIYFDGIHNALGYEGLLQRTQLENRPEKISEHLEKLGIELSDTPKTANYTDWSQPYQIAFKGSLPTVSIGEKVHIPVFASVQMKNLFVSESRKFPIDLIYARQWSYTSEINLPPGFEFAEIPPNFKLSNMLYELSFHSRLNEGKLMVEGRFELKFATYKPEFYLPLKMAMSKAVDLFNQEVTLIASRR